MLRIVRALGFIAPIAVALLTVVVLALVRQLDAHQWQMLLIVGILAAAAGLSSMALLGWSYFGWRLNRIADALESTLEADGPVRLREWGTPTEQRLARAFNAAAGAFLQVEARATHDRLTGVAPRSSAPRDTTSGSPWRSSTSTASSRSTTPSDTTPATRSFARWRR